jgi:glutamate--cysteine ligase
LPAFWVGLMYDQSALDAAWDLCKGWSAQEREALRVDASVRGLAAETPGGGSMRDLAGRCLEIAEAGLRARARPGAGGLIPDETHFLNALKESVEQGETPADELLRRWQTEWNGDLTRNDEAASY